jgi:replication-associated recombination protein RarA
VQTHHDYPADQVISAIQKEIRRGNTENAVLLGYEMVVTSPALDDYFWQRLMVISVEDFGFGAPNASILINALFQMVETFDRGMGERKLFAVHAVRYLCGSLKDRSSDEMVMWINFSSEEGEVRPNIPDYALDMHTAAGKKLNRGLKHFLDIGAQLSSESLDREKIYKERISKILDKNKKLI